MNFPVLEGENLLGQRVTLPGDLDGEFNLVLVAFQRWQQALIDSWLPAVADLEAAYPGLRHYELPVLSRRDSLLRAFINGGMRAGIPDPAVRAATITVYTDIARFRRALDLPTERDIHVLLLDPAGQVLWRAAGGYTPEKGRELAEALAQHGVTVTPGQAQAPG